MQGEEIIVVIPWDEWWELSLKDSSNPQIALLPLHPDVREDFNSTAAWEYARSMSGKPYGYHNMIFSWIDTVADNYPPPLDAHLVGLFSDHSVHLEYALLKLCSGYSRWFSWQHVDVLSLLMKLASQVLTRRF